MSDGGIGALTPRQQAAAMLVATGLYSDAVIADRLGVHPNTLRVLKSGELFQVFVQKCRERLMDKGVDEAVRILMGDARENVERIIATAKGDFHDPKVAAVQLRASEILFKRQVPEPQVVQNDTTVRVVIEQSRAAKLDGVLAEDDPVEATVVAVTAPKTFEEFAAEWQEEEEAVGGRGGGEDG